jgi:hypothetical protein
MIKCIPAALELTGRIINAGEHTRGGAGMTGMIRDGNPQSGERRGFLKTAGLGAAGLLSGRAAQNALSMTPAAAETVAPARMSEQQVAVQVGRRRRGWLHEPLHAAKGAGHRPIHQGREDL